MTTPPSEPGPYGGHGEVPVYGYTPPPPFGHPNPGAVGPGGAPQYGAPTYPPPGYGYYPPPGYPQPYGYYPMATAGTNGLAIASMVLGILWIYWIGSILALVFGYVARSQIKQRPQQGGGMAIAGIVLGWVGIAALITVIIIGVTLSNDNNLNVLLPARW